MIIRNDDRLHLPTDLIRLIFCYLDLEDGGFIKFPEEACKDQFACGLFFLLLNHFDAQARPIFASLNRMGLSRVLINTGWEIGPWIAWKEVFKCGEEADFKEQVRALFFSLAKDWKQWPETATENDFGLLADLFCKTAAPKDIEKAFRDSWSRNYEFALYWTRTAAVNFLKNHQNYFLQFLSLAIKRQHAGLLSVFDSLEDSGLLLNENTNLIFLTEILAEAINVDDTARVERYLKKYAHLGIGKEGMAAAFIKKKPELYALCAKYSSFKDERSISIGPFGNHIVGSMLFHPQSRLYLQPVLEQNRAFFFTPIAAHDERLNNSPLISAAFQLRKGAEILDIWDTKPESIPPIFSICDLLNIVVKNELKDAGEEKEHKAVLPLNLLHPSKDFLALVNHIKRHQKVYFARHPELYDFIKKLIDKKLIRHILIFGKVFNDVFGITSALVSNLPLFLAQSFEEEPPKPARLVFVKDSENTVRLTEPLASNQEQQVNPDEKKENHLNRFLQRKKYNEAQLLIRDFYVQSYFSGLGCYPAIYSDDAELIHLISTHQRGIEFLAAKLLGAFSAELLSRIIAHPKGREVLVQRFPPEKLLWGPVPFQLEKCPGEKYVLLKKEAIKQLIDQNKNIILLDQYLLLFPELFEVILAHPKGLAWLEKVVKFTAKQLLSYEFDQYVKKFPRLHDLRRSLPRLFEAIYQDNDKDVLRLLTHCSQEDEKYWMTFDLCGDEDEDNSKKAWVKRLIACGDLDKSDAVTTLARSYDYIRDLFPVRDKDFAPVLMDTNNPLLNCILFVEALHRGLVRTARLLLRKEHLHLAPFLKALSFLHWIYRALGENKDGLYEELNLTPKQIRECLGTDPHNILIHDAVREGRVNVVANLFACGASGIVLDHKLQPHEKCKEAVKRFLFIEKEYKKHSEMIQEHYKELKEGWASETLLKLLEGKPRKFMGGLWSSVYKLPSQFVLSEDNKLEEIEEILRNQLRSYFKQTNEKDLDPVFFVRAAVLQRDILPAMRMAMRRTPSQQSRNSYIHSSPF